MSKLSRTKGAAFEREIARRFTARFSRPVRRRLGQEREGGHDLIGMEPWIFECKRRRRLATLEGWLDQASAAATEENVSRYAVIARSDQHPPMAILPLSFFEDLLTCDLSLRADLFI
jgi:hypothetical protein